MMSIYEAQEIVKRMRNRTTKLEHEGDYWTEDENDKLKQMFNCGAGISEIAIALQRTEPAVMQQIEKLDLYDRKLNPTRHRSSKMAKCLCSDCVYSYANRQNCPKNFTQEDLQNV